MLPLEEKEERLDTFDKVCFFVKQGLPKIFHSVVAANYYSTKFSILV
jgi:hypothetical protein